MRGSRSLVSFLAVLSIVGAGCAKKKVAAVTPPPVAAPVTVAPAQARTSAPVRSAPAQVPSSITSASKTPDAATRKRIDDLLARISDAYFDYDRHALRPDAIQALQADSTELRDILKNYPDYKLTIEGYADERGSAEYNLGLGDARATAAKDYLVQVGIPGGQLSVLSYGKEKQICQEHNESCWQKNRRVHIVAATQ